MSGNQPPSLSQIKQLAVDITRVLTVYGFLTDSYIIEFFSDNLWETLPVSWRPALSDLTSPQLADQLLSNRKDVCYRSVWPLSLLALKATAHSLAFPRNLRQEADQVNGKSPKEFLANHCQSSMLDPLFRKHVKPKKQHEIRQLGKLVKKLSEITTCDQVLDIGSGQGHLSRYLSFGQGLSVTAVEADDNLVSMARKFDQRLIYMLQKEKDGIKQPPRHVLAWLDPKASWEDLLLKLSYGGSVEEANMDHPRAAGFGSYFGKNATGIGQDNLGRYVLGTNQITLSNHSNSASKNQTSHVVSPHHISPSNKLVLTGLHACGDLSVAMLRHFVDCPCVVGITSVACCYMKLTTREMPQPAGVLPSSHATEKAQHTEYGYPMSTWVSQLEGHKLSYKAREVACHAIEDYTERLRSNSSVLRSHCYRAVLETVIRGIDPAMKRTGVQTIKKSHKLPFKEYAEQGLKRVGLDPCTPLCESSVARMLSQQQNVVAFFSLALLLAPLVETLILLDRMIFMHEKGFQCHLVPLFKPQFSPRNLVLVATKENLHFQDLLEELHLIL
ncbi:methyltransferase-like protein 25B isoform 2-T2 [Pelodytes ibericus]